MNANMIMSMLGIDPEEMQQMGKGAMQKVNDMDQRLIRIERMVEQLCQINCISIDFEPEQPQLNGSVQNG